MGFLSVFTRQVEDVVVVESFSVLEYRSGGEVEVPVKPAFVMGPK